MNKGRKSFVMIFLVLLLALSPISASAAAATNNTKAINVTTQSIQLLFDGKELSLPAGQYTFIYQGSTYVPLRYLSYALLKQVGWDGKNNVVTVDEPSEDELVELKKNLQLTSSTQEKPQNNVKISLKPKKAKLVFAGKEKSLPAGQSLYILNGSIYVPVRFLAESTGSEIIWDGVKRSIKSESAAYRAELEENGNGSTKPGDGTSTGTSPGAGSGGGTSSGGTGGGTGTVKPSYDEITSSALASLESLRNSCETALMDMVIAYDGKDEAAKQNLAAQLNNKINSCTAEFDVIITDVTAKLSSNGYSTAIVAEYRAQFEADLKAGKELAEKLLK